MSWPGSAVTQFEFVTVPLVWQLIVFPPNDVAGRCFKLVRRVASHISLPLALGYMQSRSCPQQHHCHFLAASQEICARSCECRLRLKRTAQGPACSLKLLSAVMPVACPAMCDVSPEPRVLFCAFVFSTRAHKGVCVHGCMRAYTMHARAHQGHDANPLDLAHMCAPPISNSPSIGQVA